MASEPFLSEIQIFAFNFAPRGWALCNGQLLPINQNQALFALLGTTFGGNGTTTFALPDIQSRIPIHYGNNFTLGQQGGEETHQITQPEMPAHLHNVVASSSNVSQPSPLGNVWAKGAVAAGYSNAAGSSMNGGSIGQAGSNQAHENRAPYLALNICIALSGIFPSRN